MFFKDENKDFDPLFTIHDIYQKNHELNKTRKEILLLDEEELYDYVEKIRNYLLDRYKNKESPSTASRSKLKIKNDLMKLSDKKLIRNFIHKDGDDFFIKEVDSVGLSINHWFPEMIDCKISTTKRSVMDGIRDEKFFHNNFYRIVIKNKMGLWENDEKKLFPSFRKGMKLGTGTQSVVNFLPFVAKNIYATELLNKWKKEEELYVMDPCMGWGGRLGGLLAFSNVLSLKHDKRKINFIGTDVNTEISTHRYEMLLNFWDQLRPVFNLNTNFYTIPAENFNEIEKFQEYVGKGMMVLTSPPYFNRELYGNENTKNQSYLKFSQYDSWLTGFLQPMIQNVYDFLRPGGRFYLNIADIRQGSKILPLYSDSIKFGEKIGFNHNKTVYMFLNISSGVNHNTREEFFKDRLNMKKYKGKWQKVEPIIILEK